MDAKETVAAFLLGEMDIVTFRQECDTRPEIVDFLQGVIDEMRRTGAPTVPLWVTRGDGTKVPVRSIADDLLERNMEIYEQTPYMKPSVKTVQDVLAQAGDVRYARLALRFYSHMYSIYLQYDPDMPYDARYESAYAFLLAVVPDYLQDGPSEAFIQEQIFSQFPETMKKGERKKAIKAKIKELFPSEKSWPHWVYHRSDWPFGKDGLPAVFVRQQTNSDTHETEFIFRDRSDGALIAVTQKRGW